MSERIEWPFDHDTSSQAQERRAAYLDQSDPDDAIMIAVWGVIASRLDDVACSVMGRTLKAVAKLLTEQEPYDHWNEAEILEWLEDQVDIDGVFGATKNAAELGES